MDTPQPTIRERPFALYATRRRLMVRPALITAGAFVLMGVIAGLGAQTTGIAACDDFLKKYEACISSKVPAAQKTTYQSQLDQLRKAWADAAKNAAAKAGLESSCKQMSDQMKTAMSGFGCSF
jgi:hypothetical protein